MRSSLVSKSLVLRTTSGRYDLHELVRQFAAQRLQAGPGASGGAQAQHLSFYLALAETAAAQRKGPGQTEWLGRLAREYDNVRAALERSLADGGQQIGGLPDAGLRLVAALPWFWRVRGHFQEGRRWSLKALGRDPNGIPAPSQAPQVADPGSGGANRRREHARVLYGLALLENAMGEHEAARSSAEESARIHRELGDTQGLAEALSILGQALLWMGESAEGHSSLEEALALFRETGDRWNVAVCLFRIGTDLADYKADRRGLGMLEECAGILDELGDRLLYGSLLLALGLIATNEGDYASAASHFDRSLAIAREMGNPWDIANALTNIGCLLRIQGDYAAAGAHFEEALQMYRDRGSGTWSADPLCALAENHISQGHLAQAREKLAEAASFGQPSGNRWLEVLVGYFDGLLHYHEGDMSAATARLERTAALARASQYKPDLARALVTLGRTFSAEGEAGKALATIVEGLNIFWESGYRLGAATALEALAAISPEEVPEQAARLLGAAAAIRRSLGAPLPPVDRASHEGLTARVRKRLGDSAFSTAWAHGTEDVLDDLVVEVIRAFRSPSGGPAAGEPPVAGVPPRPQTALGST
jgi:tetratricopeptide (TPR) repeat protein